MRKRKLYVWSVITLAGLGMMLAGCNETIQGTLEDGVINVSTSLVGSFVRALIELGAEAQAATTG